MRADLIAVAVEVDPGGVAASSAAEEVASEDLCGGSQALRALPDPLEARSGALLVVAGGAVLPVDA